MQKQRVQGAVLYTGGAVAIGRPTVEETLEGRCPVCRHGVPRKIAGFFSCPCGSRVHLTGRSEAQVRRDRIKALEEPGP